MSAVHAVIIAGGEGRRMGGVRKADLTVNGVRLIDRVVRAFPQVERPILVAIGPRAAEWDLPQGCEAIVDLPQSIGGPLAGLVAAIEAVRQRGITSGLLITAAVDTPFLPDNFVGRLVAGVGDGAAAFASWGDSFYPTNAVWRLEAVFDLPEQRQSYNSLKSLLSAHGARQISWDEAALDPFSNVNTPQDLAMLDERAKHAADL